MKSIYLIALLVMMSSISLSAQEEFQVGIVIGDTIRGALLDANDFLQFPTTLENKKKVNFENRLVIHSAKIEKGDLVIHYFLNQFPKQEEDEKLKITPKVIIEQENKLEFLPSRQQDWIQTYEDNKRKRTSSELKELKWADFVEDYQLFKNQDFSLVVTGENKFEYTDPRPVKINKKPHWIGLGIGVGMLFVSSELKKKSDESKMEYKKLIFLEDFDDATKKFGEAKSDLNLSNICRISGISILAVDALIFGLRYRKYKKEKEKYDYYLERKIAVQPEIEINTPYQNIGMKVSWTF